VLHQIVMPYGQVLKVMDQVHQVKGAKLAIANDASTGDLSCVGRVPRLEATGEPEGLNVAEIELSVLSQQCLDRRISSAEELSTELAAWQQQRNSTTSKVIWHFTTEDARVKLKHLYPVFETDEIGNSSATF
jgi:hypothetical protein